MNWVRVLLSRCAAFFHRRKLDADLDEELRASNWLLRTINATA